MFEWGVIGTQIEVSDLTQLEHDVATSIYACI